MHFKWMVLIYCGWEKTNWAFSDFQDKLWYVSFEETWSNFSPSKFVPHQYLFIFKYIEVEFIYTVKFTLRYSFLGLHKWT